jgi:carotenoid epsilon hydroxylase
MEACVALAVVLSRHRFETVPGREELGMTTGATIHTLNGMWCYVRERFPERARREKELVSARV